MQDLCTKIEKLNIGKVTMNILKNNEIKTVKDLCDCTRVKLIKLGIERAGVIEIMISLQLLGLDIKPNYKRVCKANN